MQRGASDAPCLRMLQLPDCCSGQSHIKEMWCVQARVVLLQVCSFLELPLASSEHLTKQKKRECQKSDWKDHKKFCSKLNFDPSMIAPSASTPAQYIGCPTPEPGFQRTPALWRQIFYLSKSDSQTRDYHVCIRLWLWLLPSMCYSP
jgi:hypothetical protein